MITCKRFYAINKQAQAAAAASKAGGGSMRKQKGPKARTFEVSMPSLSELQRKQRGVDSVDIEGQKKLDRQATVALSQAAFDQATALLDEGKGYEDKYGCSQGITRVEFILALLRISIDRHVRTKETSDVSEALDRLVRRTMHLLRTHFRRAPPHLTLAHRHAAASVMPQPAPQPPA